MLEIRFFFGSYLLAESLDIGLGELFALHQVLDPAVNITDISNGRHFFKYCTKTGMLGRIRTEEEEKRLRESFLSTSRGDKKSDESLVLVSGVINT